jgi:uncharacterized protein YjlB
MASCHILSFDGETQMKDTPLVTPWAGPVAPTQSALQRLLREEGLEPYSWSNGPFDVYSAHSHSYDKVIYVIQGSITFGLPELDKQLALNPGDRLDLPAGVVHDAHVGAQGVVCLEAHRSGL